MQFEAFCDTIKNTMLPEGLSVYLRAMWYDAYGSWAEAHSLVDNLENTTACWVHAYLHRKERDISNAEYWYRKAGKKNPDIPLHQEWEIIVKALL